MTEEENLDPASIMFLVGGQTSAEGDWVASSFSICSTSMEPEAFVDKIMSKIVDDLTELNIKSGEGAIAIEAIQNWQQFADLKMDSKTKMDALAAAINDEFLHAFCRTGSSHAHALAAAPWGPTSKEG